METQLFEFDTSLHRLGDDLSLFQELVDFFMEDAPGLIATIRSAGAQGDLKTAHRAAHSLRSLVANFDAKDAMASAQEIELLLAKGDLRPVPKALARLENEVDSLCQALQSFAPRQQ